jgi:dipeptidyl aminopeptidase/acylaminoacyl peptidase
MRIMAKINYFRALATVLAVTLAAGVLTLVQTKPAEAAFPPGQNGPVVYAARALDKPEEALLNSDNAQYEIYSIVPDPNRSGGASKPIRLTDNSWNDFDPVLSRDGQEVAYDCGGLICVQSSTGGAYRELTDGSPVSTEPTWSPDGTKITYTCDYSQICTVSSEGGEPETLTSTDGGTCPRNPSSPDYSPNGWEIALQFWDGNDWEIGVMPANGGNLCEFQFLYRLTDNSWDDKNPAWSPDGQKIAYSGYDGHDYEIYEVSRDGEGLPQPKTNHGRNDIDPDYSPDGKHLVWSRETKNPRSLIDRILGSPQPPPDYEIYTRLASDSVGKGGTNRYQTNNYKEDINPDWGLPKDTTPPNVFRAPSPAHPDAFPVDSYIVREGDGYKVPIKLTWEAQDPIGISGYELERSVNGGAWSKDFLERIAIVDPATWTELFDYVKPGDIYQYRLRAKDTGGNLSEWVEGFHFKVNAFQEDRTELISYPTGNWKTVSASDAYGGHLKRTSNAGATARFSLDALYIAWVSTKSPEHGQAEVWVNGVKRTTVNLNSTTAQARRVVFSEDFGAPGFHTVEVKGLGSTGSPNVDVDAFLVLIREPQGPGEGK